MSEVKSRDMTPKKNEIFSRVRTTFADCQAVERDAIRLETFISVKNASTFHIMYKVLKYDTHF